MRMHVFRANPTTKIKHVTKRVRVKSLSVRCYDFANGLRSPENQQLEARVVGKLGWAYIVVAEYECALNTFRRMGEVSLRPRQYRVAPRYACVHVSNILRASNSLLPYNGNRCPNRLECIKKVVDPQSIGHDDLSMSWGARRGAATALVGLGQGKDALAEAMAAMELADQARVMMSPPWL